MDKIIEEVEESKSDTWWKHLRQRLNQSTFLVQDCVFILYIVLVSVVVSFSTLSDNMLDIFYYASNKSEPVATAYTQILYDLQYAFFVIGGLLSDCIYGRIPVMVFSFLIYVISIAITQFLVCFLSSPFPLVFAMTVTTCIAYGAVMVTAMTLLLNYEYVAAKQRTSALALASSKILLVYAIASIVIRSIMHWTPFLTGFRCLSLLSLLLNVSVVRLSLRL